MTNKPTKIKYLTEIDTSRAYMLKEHLIYFPKAPTSGWLRGDVNVLGFRTIYRGVYEAQVVAKQVLTDNSMTILVGRNEENSPWEFSPTVGSATIHLAPPSWKENLLNQSLQEIMSLENQISRIHDRMRRIKNSALY